MLLLLNINYYSLSNRYNEKDKIFSVNKNCALSDYLNFKSNFSLKNLKLLLISEEFKSKNLEYDYYKQKEDTLNEDKENTDNNKNISNYKLNKEIQDHEIFDFIANRSFLIKDPVLKLWKLDNFNNYKINKKFNNKKYYKAIYIL